MDVAAGLAQFHTSYMPLIEKYATEYRVDPRHLIIAVCKKNRTEATDGLVKAEAEHLARQGVRGTWRPLYEKYVGGEQNT